MMMRRGVLLPCSVLAALLVVCSGVSASTGLWAGLESSMWSGKCLNTTGLIIPPRSSFEPVMEIFGWQSHMLNTVLFKTIFEEALNYTVRMWDDSSLTAGEILRMASGETHINVETWEGYDPYLPAETYPDNFRAISNGDVKIVAPLGYGNARAGMYFSTRTLRKNPHLLMEHWRSWRDPEVINLFKNATWSSLTEGDLLNPTPCINDSVLVGAGGLPAGCVDGLFKPPNCVENATRDCAVMFMFSPGWDPGVFQQIVTNLELNITLAWIKDFFTYPGTRVANDNDVLKYHWAPDSGTSSICSDADGEFPCWTRIRLPENNPECWAKNDFTHEGGVDCDILRNTVTKYASQTVQREASDIYHVLENARISNAQISSMFHNLTGSGDIRLAVCDWLRSHHEMWRSWLPPPPLCPDPGYEYRFGDCIQCTPGHFEVERLCYECPAGTYAAENASTECTKCAITAYNPNKAQALCQSCPPNQETGFLASESLSDCNCMRGFFDRNNGNSALQDCIPCPLGAVCLGGAARPFSAEGFWMNDDNPLVFLKCAKGNSCPEQSQLNSEDEATTTNSTVCAVGYTGALCSQCADTYFRMGNSCEDCGSRLQRVTPLLIFLVVFLVLVVAVLVTFGTKQAARNSVWSYRVRSCAVVLAVTVSFLQTIAVFKSLRTWPAAFQDLLDIVAVINFDTDYLRIDCLNGPISFYDKFRFKSLFFMALGLVAAAAYGILTLIGALELREKLLWLSLTVFNLTTIIALSVFAELFFCYDQDSIGDRSLSADPSIICYDSSDWKELLGFMIVSFLCYIAMPLVVIVRMIQSFHKNYSQFIERDIANGERTGSYGGAGYRALNISSYQPEFHFWFLISLSRKFVIIFLIPVITYQFSSEDQLDHMTASFLAFALLMYFGMQIAYAPWLFAVHNTLESALLLILTGLIVFFMGGGGQERLEFIYWVFFLSALALVVWALVRSLRLTEGKVNNEISLSAGKQRGFHRRFSSMNLLLSPKPDGSQSPLSPPVETDAKKGATPMSPPSRSLGVLVDSAMGDSNDQPVAYKYKKKQADIEMSPSSGTDSLGPWGRAAVDHNRNGGSTDSATRSLDSTPTNRGQSTAVLHLPIEEKTKEEPQPAHVAGVYGANRLDESPYPASSRSVRASGGASPWQDALADVARATSPQNAGSVSPLHSHRRTATTPDIFANRENMFEDAFMDDEELQN